MKGSLFSAAVLSVIFYADADLVIYSDDFLTTPPGWSVSTSNPSTNFISFGPTGVQLRSYSGWINFRNQSVVTVPWGTDHLNLTATQQTVLFSEGYYVPLAGLGYYVDGSWQDYLYFQYIEGGADTSISTPIDVDFAVPAGSVVGFELGTCIDAVAGGPREMRSLAPAPVESRFRVTDFVLTAVGDIGLDESTWGSIKSLF